MLLLYLHSPPTTSFSPSASLRSPVRQYDAAMVYLTQLFSHVPHLMIFHVHPPPRKGAGSLKQLFPGKKWMCVVLKNVLPQQLDTENANKILNPVEY